MKKLIVITMIVVVAMTALFADASLDARVSEYREVVVATPTDLPTSVSADIVG